MHFLTGSARYDRLSEVVSDWSVVEIPANDWFDASAMVAREVVMVSILTSGEGINAAGDVVDLHGSTINSRNRQRKVEKGIRACSTVQTGKVFGI